MNLRHALHQTGRDVRALVAAPTGEPAEPDGDQLARELTRAFIDELALHRRLREAQPELLNPAEPPEGHELDAIRAMYQKDSPPASTGHTPPPERDEPRRHINGHDGRDASTGLDL